MTNNIALTDDMKSVERWENEGGKVSPFNSAWTALKNFRTERNSRERQVIDSHKKLGQQPGVLSEFSFGRVA